MVRRAPVSIAWIILIENALGPFDVPRRNFGGAIKARLAIDGEVNHPATASGSAKSSKKEQFKNNCIAIKNFSRCRSRLRIRHEKIAQGNTQVCPYIKWAPQLFFKLFFLLLFALRSPCRSDLLRRR